MKKIMTLIVFGVLLFCGSAFAQNVINFENVVQSKIDICATYQTTNPFYPGVLITTTTGCPIVVRANNDTTTPCISVPNFGGNVVAFRANSCGTNTVRNYPVKSGYNSLADDTTDFQRNFTIDFAYPIKDFSLWVNDWGDWLVVGSGTTSTIQLTAYDKDGNTVGTGSRVINKNWSGTTNFVYDATNPDGIVQISVIASNVKKVKIEFIGLIDPALTIDDITFNGDMDIDIKPGSYPNCFNSDTHGVIPVAILGSEDFDVTILDPSTVTLDGQAVRVKGKSGNAGSYEDVNDDGYMDLVVQIIDDGIYNQGTGTGTVTAVSYDGVIFQGQDSLCITQ